MTPDPNLSLFIKHVRFWWLLPALIWAAVIFVIISMPPENIPRTPMLRFPHADKAVHFILFAIFGGLLLQVLSKQLKNRPVVARHMLMALLIGSVYGVFTEYYQHCCLPGRHGNITDTIANVFGTVFGVTLMAFVLQRGFKKNQKQKSK